MRCSGTDRALVCPASLVLPKTETPNPKRDKAAAFGTAMHAWWETGDSDDDAVLKKVLMSGVRRRDYWPATGEHEVSFAIHLPTAKAQRFEGPHDEADEWKAAFDPEYLTGTIDYLGRYRGRPWVDDLKTGTWPVDPRKANQLLSYLLLPWIEEGQPRGADYYRGILQYPRYPLAGLPERKGPHPVTGIRLMLHLENLRYAIDNTDEANPTRDGCWFCDSKPHCDAYQRERNR
jgi:hypothetical protein